MFDLASSAKHLNTFLYKKNLKNKGLKRQDISNPALTKQIDFNLMVRKLQTSLFTYQNHQRPWTYLVPQKRKFTY